MELLAELLVGLVVGSKEVDMANAGMWQGAAQGMRDLSATGMGILNFQQNREHQAALENEARARTLLDQDRLRMQEETSKLQNKALQIAAAEAEDKVKLISLPDRLTQMGIKNPEEQKVFMERFAPYIEEGVSGTPMVQKKHFEDVGKTLVTDPQFGVQYGTVRTKRIRAEINGLLSGEIKPDKGVEPQAQIDTLVKQLELAENKVAAYNQQIPAKNKDQYETVQLADGTWASVDRMNPNAPPIPLSGKPKSVVEKQMAIDEAKAKGGPKAFKPYMNSSGGIELVNVNDPTAQEMINEKGLKPYAKESPYAGKPQQSMFVDPETQQPLIFDPKEGTYKIAPVQGGGAVSPRMVNPSAGEREKTAAFSVLKDQLQRIKDTYKSKYVGLVAGQVGRVTQWKDSDEAGFRQVILDVKDSLLRARSGAQINEQEYERLAKLVPDFTDSEKQFSGKMKSFETTINAIMGEREKAQKKGGVFIRGVGQRVGRFIVEVE